MLTTGAALLAVYFITSVFILLRVLGKRIDKLLFIVFNTILAFAAAAACADTAALAWFFLGFAVFYLLGLFFFALDYAMSYFNKLKNR